MLKWFAGDVIHTCFNFRNNIFFCGVQPNFSLPNTKHPHKQPLLGRELPKPLWVQHFFMLINVLVLVLACACVPKIIFELYDKFSSFNFANISFNIYTHSVELYVFFEVLLCNIMDVIEYGSVILTEIYADFYKNLNFRNYYFHCVGSVVWRRARGGVINNKRI